MIVLARSPCVITPKYPAAVEKRVMQTRCWLVFLMFQRGQPRRLNSGGGRQEYDAKRQTVLNSTAHLVEIDLRRTGEPKS